MKTLLIALLMVNTALFAQSEIDFNHYHSLKCSGEIPSQFNDLGANLPEVRLRLKRLLYSGNVLYGDPLTLYVEKVADNALKSDPGLRKQLKFFVVKSSTMNALCNPDGVVMVTTGMLAKIENEAQLAFIICHESIHFKLNHNSEFNKKKEDLNQSNKIDNYQRYSQLMSFSRVNEFEADRLGYELFKNSDYELKNVESALNILKNANKPFSNIKWTIDYFTQNAYRLPQALHLAALKGDDKSENQPILSEFNSHPELDDRINEINVINRPHATKGNVQYCISKEHFDWIQKIARHEQCIIELQNAEAQKAFYSAYLIEKLYGESAFTNEIMGAALYAVTKQKNKIEALKLSPRELANQTPEWILSDGEAKRLYYFFHKLPAKEMEILSAAYLFKMYDKYGTEFFKSRLDQCLFDLTYLYKLKSYNFKTAVEDSLMISSPNSMYALSVQKEGLIYYHYSFYNTTSIDKLRNAFIDAEIKSIRLKNLEQTPRYIDFKKDSSNLVKNYGAALNIHAITMEKPDFNSYNDYYIYKDSFYFIRKINNNKISSQKNEVIRKNYEKWLIDFSEEKDLKIKFIGVQDQVKMNTESFNHFQSWMTWKNEHFNYGDLDLLSYSFDDLPKDSSYLQFAIMSFEHYLNSITLKFYLFDPNTDKIVYTWVKNIEKTKPLDVEVKCMVYEIIDHLTQTPDKINQLKTKYEGQP
ncbi:MAG TPA: M48 family metallopeptidase [Bacteroidia bacterium]